MGRILVNYPNDPLDEGGDPSGWREVDLEALPGEHGDGGNKTGDKTHLEDILEDVLGPEWSMLSEVFRPWQIEAI